MPSLREQLEAWIKPLQLEEKQDYLNRSVVGGLDKFIVKGCERLLTGPDVPKDLSVFLKQLKKDFTQYMTLSPAERKALVRQSREDIGAWAQKLPLKAAVSKKMAVPAGALTDNIHSLIPADKSRAFQLTKLKTAEDILKYTPKWAVHKSSITPLSQCTNREEGYFMLVRINGISQVRQGPRDMIKVVLEDATGHLSWVWFNRPYLRKELQNGRWVLLHETPQVSKWGKQITGKNDTFEFLTEQEVQDLQAGKVLVFYPSTPSLTQVFWRSLLDKVLQKYLGLLSKIENHTTPFAKLSLAAATEGVHRPASLEAFETSRKRLAYEELLTLQTFLIAKRRAIEKRDKGRKYQFEGEKILKFRKSIPYQLTGAQKKVLKEIRENLSQTYPMNRLLQGDVGSGKTLVAAISVLYAADSGVQSALMAPTEILSQQHFFNIQRLLEPLGLRTALLTSDMKVKAKREVLASIANGMVDLVVGTHALIEDAVQFQNLGFMVIDERHKFGVLQRAALESKGKWPDCLMMTATPFPRALVLTEYGDTDLSVLDEFPKGRKSIKTYWKNEGQKNSVYQFAKERMLQGEQVFWVFPVVEESKNFLKSATQMYQHFQKEVFHGFKVGLIHGKMKKEEKDAVMKDFADKKVQLLVSTTVVEVGVDIPNATIMVIEHAERFGLAQLHQLRGRVGRGERQSHCFLLTSPVISSDAIERMKIMVSTLDGFRLSEFDLKMRGPGEIFGLAQSGRREGGIVDLKRDIDVVEEAHRMALVILDKDPQLKWEEHKSLKDNLMSKYQPVLDLAQIS